MKSEAGTAEDRRIEEDVDMAMAMPVGHEGVDVDVAIRVGEVGDGDGAEAEQTHRIERLFCSHARVGTGMVVSRGPTIKMVAECCILLGFVASHRAVGRSTWRFRPR